MDLTEILEWRTHGSHDLITYTEFGPYMVDGIYAGKPRAWLPDEAQQCRIMCEGFSDLEAAKAFCQSDLDGRRSIKAVKDCSEFLFDGETPAERIMRERQDVELTVRMLAAEREKVEALRGAAQSALQMCDIIENISYADASAFRDLIKSAALKAEGHTP